MLAAPLKVSKEVNWEKSLHEYIKAQFGGENVAKEYANDLQRLNNARKRASQIVVPDEPSFEAIKKYISLLHTVTLRFPTLKGGEGKSEWKNLAFGWTDAFRPKTVLAQTDIEFERACMMFNLGALESLGGIQQDMKTVESLKIACTHFTRAAGAFACLERGMTADDGSAPSRLSGTLTSDLSPEGLGMLKNLMLAQAQFCCFERALKDEMKPGVLAKVAAQVAKFYEISLGFARNPTLSKVLDPAWANHIEFHKRKNDSWCAFYHAQAIFEKAQNKGTGYGEQVAWLTKAETICRSAWEWASKKGLPGGLILPIKNLLDKIQSDLVTANNDNSKIYFEVVPDPNSLPSVDGHVLAKATPVEDRLLKITPTDDPIFKNLLVPWMRTAEEQFQMKLSGLVRAYGDKVTNRTSEVRQGLSDAGLPASVEAGADSEQGVPNALWQRISTQVLAKGGIPQLFGDAAENKRSNEFLAQKLRELEQDLQAERDADHGMRSQYGPSFQAQPSTQLNRNMETDLSQYRTLLSQARKSDDSAAEQIRANDAFLQLLTQTREQLTNYLPDVKGAIESDPNVDRVRNELMVLLVDLGAKVQECETSQTQFVEAVSGATVVSELEKADKGKAQEIVNKAMENFTPFIQEVDSKLSSISAKFNAVLERNHSFAALRTQNEATKKREKALSGLNTAIAKYTEISTLVREGAQFYADLGTQIEQLRVVIQDFCFVRNVERDDYIESRAGNGAGGASRASAGSFVDAPSAPVLSAPIARPISYGSSATPIAMPVTQASHRPPPAPPISASSAGGALYKPELIRMKSALGLYDVPDAVLEPYMAQAKGDLNLAMDKYFANPPPDSALQQQQQPPPRASGAAVGKSGRGWFQ